MSQVRTIGRKRLGLKRPMNEDRGDATSEMRRAARPTTGVSGQGNKTTPHPATTASSPNAGKLRLLRLIVVGICAWFTVVIIIPDFVLGVLLIDVPSVHAMLDTLSAFVLGAGIVYLMVQISYLTTVIRPVLWGIAFLAISQGYRVLGILDVWDNTLNGWWRNAMGRLLEDAFTGIGLVLALGGLLYAIVELLRTRYRLEDEHAALVQEAEQRRQTQKALLDQRAKMVNSARLTSLGEMASGLAHEINNPLAIISVASQQLVGHAQDGTLEPSRTAALIESISRNVRRIEDIIRGLRSLSRDGSKDSFVLVPVGSILDETLEVCRARFADCNIRLDVVPLPDNVCIECRSSQISQVVLNLLNNAFDAVVEAPEKWVRLEVACSNGWIDISVTDSGLGPPREVVDRIMEPFFTTKKAGRGMGLGLSVSKAIAEAHHGDLSYDSSGPYTRFVLHLPERQLAPVAALHGDAANHP